MPLPSPSQQRAPLRVGIAGLGTVGMGVVRLLEDNAALIARRAGRAIEVVAVSARAHARDRGADLSRYAWAANMSELVADPHVDAIVEVVGGADGPALALAQAALAARKPLVTANKAMIAHHGMALARIADGGDVPLKFEAAVAGGIPVIKALREGASANRIDRVYGILNGTCNFILTRMEASVAAGAGRTFEEVLAEAQALGFAEADPSFDVDGVDAGHKLSILAALCFGTRLSFPAVRTSGIRGLVPDDFREAHALGYRIRLIGMAEQAGAAMMQSVQPWLVPADHPLGYVPGALNAVVAEGSPVGRLFFEGAGAGAGPTASAVVADLIDVARDEYGPAFAMPVDDLIEPVAADPLTRVGKHYLRASVADRAGVLAEIAIAMRDAGVSVESFIQRGAHDGAALIAMVTHACSGAEIAAAVARLGTSPNLLGRPMVMPILEL